MTWPKFNAAQWMVVVMALEDFVVAGVYLFSRDFKHGLYWLFAGGIASVTIFM